MLYCRKIKLVFFVFVLFSSHRHFAQIPTFSLQEAIELAKERSIASLQATTRKENSYWQWRTYLSGYNPQLSIQGSLFDFNRTFTPVTQPDGNTLFQPISNNNTSLSLNMNQSVVVTGTEFFVQSQLNRFDDFDGNFTRYSGNPIIVGLRQPLFSFNELKWNKNIEPLRYEESQKSYTAELEDIAKQTTEYFFDLLEGQVRFATSKTNMANADTLLAVGEKRYAKGNIFKNDILQLKLARKTAEKTLWQAEVDLENATQRLNAFMGIPEEERLLLDIPNNIPQFEVDVDVALEQAHLNRAEITAFERQKKEAQRDMAQAKSESGLNVDFYATFGLTNRADNISGLYQDATDRETFRMGFNIPILDWGRSEARQKTALANQKLIEYSVAQEEINFRQKISSQARQFRSLRKQLEIAHDSNEIAQERYELAKTRYLKGGINITELNIALQEKDNAKNDLIGSLRSFWSAYYNLRYLTLYDFENNTGL